MLFQQPRTFSSLLYRWWEIKHNPFLTFLIHGCRGGELAVILSGSVLPEGLGLPQSKIGMTWIWPIFYLLGLSQWVQEAYDQILLTSTLCGTPKCSKKCLSLCLSPVWLKALNLSPITRGVCESVGSVPCEYEGCVEKCYELGSQSCFSAMCTVGTRCRWCPLLALCYLPL